RDLAKTFAGIAVYSVGIGAAYLFEHQPIRELANAFGLIGAFFSTAYLLRFSHRLAGGSVRGRKLLGWFVGAIGAVNLVMLVDLVRRALSHRDTDLPTAAQNGTLLLLFVSVAIALARMGFGATDKEHAAAGRAY